MYSLMITVISIDEVAKLMQGQLQQYEQKQETFIATIGSYRLKITGSCAPITGPPVEHCVTTYFRTIFIFCPPQMRAAQ